MQHDRNLYAHVDIAHAVLHISAKTCENKSIPFLKIKIHMKINKLQTCWTK
jgi:hypothetical protein